MKLLQTILQASYNKFCDEIGANLPIFIQKAQEARIFNKFPHLTRYIVNDQLSERIHALRLLSASILIGVLQQIKEVRRILGVHRESAKITME